ncbi:hypothetical protein MMC21_001152 [Puttea exsequens]|nr:hypothetical protein [Puttea exsequens]
MILFAVTTSLSKKNYGGNDWVDVLDLPPPVRVSDGDAYADNGFSIIHFVLFVFACITTHKHRKAMKQSTGERRNIELTYHRSPEEHNDQQPPAYTPSAEGSLRTPTSTANQEEDPFKDPERNVGLQKETNPFGDHSALKYA